MVLGGHSIICRRCKQPGHFARGCASTHYEPHVPSDLQNCEQPALSINTVTSFYLSGTVSGLTLSFLVDNGAGVLLINGKIWKKLKQDDI